VRQTQVDVARANAGRGAGGRDGARPKPAAPARAVPAVPLSSPQPSAAPRSAARQSPAVAASNLPAAASDRPARRGRPASKAKAKEESAPAARAVPCDEEYCTTDEERSAAEGPRWDAKRAHPTLLPFRGPPARQGAAAGSPLAELGLGDGAREGRLFLMQLPSLLPVSAAASTGCASLDALREGLLGTLEVRRSGSVHLRVGGVLFDVMPGAPLAHCEQVAALNCAQGQAVLLGTAQSRVVCTPDASALLDAAKEKRGEEDEGF